MYRQNKKKLAMTVVMFFITLLFSNFSAVSASADTINNNPFTITTSTSTNNTTYTPVSEGGNNISTGSKGAVYFRINFKADNPQPGDKITFTLPSPLADINLIHAPNCFNTPILNGDTVTLIANKNVEHVVGGYLTIKANYNVDNGTQSSNIPVNINGNNTPIHIKNTTYNPHYNDGSGSGTGTSVNPINQGGSIVKTVNGSQSITINNLNSTNNTVHFKVQVNTTKMTVNGIFKDIVNTPGLAILPNTIKIVNNATGQDVTNQLRPDMIVDSSYENSSITITNFPKDVNYTITYNGVIDIDYPGIKNTSGHYLSNTASIGGASSTVSIYVIEKEITLTKNEIDGLTTKYNGGSSTYSNLGQVKQFNLNTNYYNYVLPPGLTVTDTMPEGLTLDETNPFTLVQVRGPNDSKPQGPINIIYISKSGQETGQKNPNAVADLYVNYQLNKIELIIEQPTNNSFWINYNTIVSKPFKASITNTVKTSLNGITGTASATIKYSATDGVIKAWKSVNKKSIVFGENPDVQYSININSLGSFPNGYLNIKDPLAKGITFENVQLPQGFKYTFDAQTNTLNITNTEPIIGAQGAAYDGEIVINASLKNAKEGTTIDNTAIVNGYPTSTVKTAKGYAFTATKEAEGTNKALEGAVYGVYNSNNQELYTVTSNANGVMTGVISGPGNYYLKEITAPKGYLVNKTEIPFNVTTNDIGTTIQIPTVYDKLAPTTGNIKITKTNESGDVLSGATFVAEQNGNVIKTQTTNSEGVAEFTGLPIGTYTIVETKAPTGYETSQPVENVNVEGGQTTKEKIVDKEIKGKLEITKQSSTGQKLAGAVFSITGPNGYTLNDVTTGSNGVAEVDNLAWGTYTIKEVTAPIGYTLNSKPQSVTIGPDNASQVQKETFVDQELLGQLQITKEGPNGDKLQGAEFTVTGPKGFTEQTVTTNAKGVASLSGLPWGTYTVTETKAPQGYELNGTPQQVVVSNASVGGIQNLTFNDSQKVGSLQVIKEGPNKERLQGAEFTVKGPNGVDKVITTDKDGVASLSNLAWGKYTVQETKAPAGYSLNKVINTVDINAQDVAQTQMVTVMDGVATGTVEIEKTDITNGQEVAGAKIQITGTSITGKKEDATFTSGTTPTPITLPAGTYTYKEVSAPVGYQVSTTVGQFTISKQGQIVKADVEDARVLGRISITKTGADGVKLAGAQFTVSGPNGFKEVVTTNNDGVASLNNLAWGTYTVKETKAPIGYTLSNEIKTITIDANDAQQVQAISVNDGQVLGQLQITKEGSNGKKLEGAEFTVAGTNGFTGTVTTNENGVATVDNLQWGTYTVTEIKAPQGYQVDEKPQTVNITASSVGGLQNLVFKDSQKLGNMQIVKTGINGAKLEGAQFTVTGPNGYKEVVTTDKDGVANLAKLAWGTYNVQETKAPAGYNLDSNIQTVNINAQDVTELQTVTVNDAETTGTLNIEKTDITNGQEVAGAKILIQGTSDNGQKVNTTFTSGTTPTIFTLPAGTYTYTEVDAPVGYQINKTVGHFTISKQGQIVKADVKDARVLGGMSITKINENGTKKLEGAQFTVTGPNGYKEVVTTNKDGVANLKDLAWGTYKVQETKAPTGYAVNNTVQTVKIDAQDAAQVQSVTLADGVGTGTLVIEKTDITNGKEVAGAKIQITGTAINGQKIDKTFVSGTTPTKFTLPAGTYTYTEVDAPVGYQINKTVGHFTISKQGQIVKADVKDARVLGQMSITKTNTNGTKKLEGAQFTVTGPNGYKEVVTTNAEGVANLKDLAWGTYNVQETKAPVGYALNNTVQTVDINAQDAAQVQALTVEDGVATGTLVIEKTDITNEKEVAGAKIQIQGTSISGEKIDKTFVSGTTPTKFTLPAGTYTYTEVDAPVGYLINKTVGHFTISKQGQIVKADVKDARILGEMTITKTNENGTEKLEGAQFTVTGPNGYKEVVTTNKDGVANLKDLAWGIYTVKETKAPIGYSLNNETQTVKIDAQDAAKMQLVNLKDAKILGQISITKTNENGTVKLQGAEFTVTGPNGYKEVVTTNKDGVANLKDLAWGTYKVRETKAPVGYSLNNTIQTVEVTAASVGKVQSVSVKDNQILGNLTITKTNENGTKTLQGAEFEVTGPNGYKEVVTTGANGIASLSNLEWGTYYVKEIKAPQGYNINNTIYRVNINAQDALKVQAVKVKDSQIEQVSTTHNTTTSNNNKTIGNTSNTNKTTGNTSNTTSNSSSQGLSPKTGDASELPIYGLLAIAIVGLVANTRRKKKLAK